MQADERESAAELREEPPLIVQGVNTLLVLGILVWTVGVFTSSRHLLDALDAGEARAALLSDVRLIAQQLVMCVASVVSFVTMRRRRSIGRWIAVALGVALTLVAVFALRNPVRAMNGDLRPVGAFRYESREDAKRQLAFGGLIAAFQAAVTIQLARSKGANRYFGGRG